MGFTKITDSNTAKVIIGSTTTKVLDAVTGDTPRTYVIAGNDSDEAIYLGLGNNAVLNSGVYLAPGITILLAGFLRFDGQINAICTSGSKNLSIEYGY